jgi:hypothetical protein
MRDRELIRSRVMADLANDRPTLDAAVTLIGVKEPGVTRQSFCCFIAPKGERSGDGSKLFERKGRTIGIGS